MKKIDYKFTIFLVCVVLVICILWWTLELIFYGEIQPRIADDCIGLFWIAAICFAYRFEDIDHKRKTGKRDKEFGTWWLRQPPNSSAYTHELTDKIWIQSEYELGVHRESDCK